MGFELHAIRSDWLVNHSVVGFEKLKGIRDWVCFLSSESALLYSSLMNPPLPWLCGFAVQSFLIVSMSLGLHYTRLDFGFVCVK